MGRIVRISALFTIVAVFISTFAWSEEGAPTRIAVLDFNSMGLDRAETDRVTDAFRIYLDKTLNLKVFDPSPMYQVMDDEGYPRQIPCTDDSCIIELGTVLGVDFIIAANIGRIGDILSISLWMLNVKNGHVVSTVMENYQCTFNAFVEKRLHSVATKTAHAVLHYFRSGLLSSAPRTGTWSVFSQEEGVLPSNNVLCIAEDLDGVVWLGMKAHGVMAYNNGTWRTYGRSQGIPDNDIWSIAVDARNHKWFGTIGGGACRFDGKKWKYYTVKNGLASNYVSGIVCAPNSNDVWFLSWDSGVTLLRNGRFTVYTEKDGLIDNDVRSMAITSEGTVLFGTYKGVSVFDGVTWTHLSSDYTYGQFTGNGNSGLADNYVRAMTVDLQGRIWYGTYRGVSCQTDSVWTGYMRKDGLADNNVYSIQIDNYGMLWCGTYGGVSRFDGITWNSYTSADGLAGNNTKIVAIDRKNNKWFSSAEKGVTLYTGD